MGRLSSGHVSRLSTFLVVVLSSCGPASSSSSGGNSVAPPSPALDVPPTLGAPTQPVTELFSSDVPLEFVLATDFERLEKDRSQESEDRPGQLFIRNMEGEVTEIPMQVRTRGNFRLRRSTCSAPPLRLNLPETRPQGTVLDGLDKLKLVTHCRDSDRYEQNLLEEYLAYRIYNQLTDISFRVQLAKVTYVDTSGENEDVTRMAFLIEDEDVMAERLGGRMIETPVVDFQGLVQDQLGLMFLFQFMVGNVDWGITASHNVKILLKDGEYHPIPYDFDWTGLVDAPYAEPNELTDRFHSSVRERLYWGICLPGMDYGLLFGRFSEKRDQIMGLVDSHYGLSDDNVRSATSYLEEFFDIIHEPRAADRAILNACRNKG